MTTDVGASHEMDQKADLDRILNKLLTFSITLTVAPIGSYFICISYIFKGNPINAAITAIATSILVLAAFMFAPFLNDDTRKSRHTVVDGSESKEVK
ncbi:hypothetical protein BOTBODRAFT_27116 [Botryobasidium botryosum FD-172 SS1]|uniref:Vacuolar ATPase assembly integral membrane protein VMA21 n=1 Tax=Botryobasidium botryosum (strain FD-172 SS1) TaxID=930990 RepID=A0A067MZR8_BOTB1|nr:hypothetical protein BOTBODRAFT_27116 [Botryobasidium botryosum FD-172 SS1]